MVEHVDATEYRLGQLEKRMDKVEQKHESVMRLLVGNLVGVVLLLISAIVTLATTLMTGK